MGGWGIARFLPINAHTRRNAPTSDDTKGTGFRSTGEDRPDRLRWYRKCSRNAGRNTSSGSLWSATTGTAGSGCAARKSRFPARSPVRDQEPPLIPGSYLCRRACILLCSGRGNLRFDIQVKSKTRKPETRRKRRIKDPRERRNSSGIFGQIEESCRRRRYRTGDIPFSKLPGRYSSRPSF